MNLDADPITVMYAEAMVAANRDVFEYPGDVDGMLESPELSRLRTIEAEATAAGVFVSAYALRRQIEREA